MKMITNSFIESYLTQPDQNQSKYKYDSFKTTSTKASSNE